MMLAIVSLCSFVLGHGGVTVALPPEAHVRGTELVLGEIAAVSGADAADAARVSELRLGYAPAPGYSRLLQAARLRQEIAARLPGVAFELSGSPACRVWPRTERVAAAAIEAAARAEIERRIASSDASARLLGGAQDLDVPAARGGVELRSMLPSAEVRPGNLSVPVRVVVDGTTYRTLWTTWSIELWGPRPVLVRDVRAGEAIPAAAVRLERVELAGLAGEGELSSAMIAGARAARELRAGTALRQADLVRPFVVEKDATLFLEIRKGPVRATVVARAGEQGAVGDKVRVTVLGTEREVTAVVAARDLVVIDLSQKTP